MCLNGCTVLKVNLPAATGGGVAGLAVTGVAPAVGGGEAGPAVTGFVPAMGDRDPAEFSRIGTRSSESSKKKARASVNACRRQRYHAAIQLYGVQCFANIRMPCENSSATGLPVVALYMYIPGVLAGVNWHPERDPRVAAKPLALAYSHLAVFAVAIAYMHRLLSRLVSRQ